MDEASNTIREGTPTIVLLIKKGQNLEPGKP
jgi:hypothetical protein